MGWVYLIKNGDLYKIGITENLKQRLKQLKPGVLIQSQKSDRSRNIEYELHKLYKKCRIPQTEYFRLTPEQVSDVRKKLGWVPHGESCFIPSKNSVYIPPKECVQTKEGRIKSARAAAAMSNLNSINNLDYVQKVSDEKGIYVSDILRNSLYRYISIKKKDKFREKIMILLSSNINMFSKYLSKVYNTIRSPTRILIGDVNTEGSKNPILYAISYKLGAVGFVCVLLTIFLILLLIIIAFFS